MTDMRTRVRVVKDRAEKMEARAKEDRARGVHMANQSDVIELAYLVAYLATVMDKHLETGEA
jgi:hypothetical protein